MGSCSTCVRSLLEALVSVMVRRPPGFPRVPTRTTGTDVTSLPTTGLTAWSASGTLAFSLRTRTFPRTPLRTGLARTTTRTPTTAGEEELCPLYQAESENVKGKGYCDGLREATPGNDITSGSEINNQAQCDAIEEFEWKDSEPHGLPAPECRPATDVWSRVNHLGNGMGGWQNSYTWTLPAVSTEQVCVFRMRYNISTTDYDGWNTFADMNGNTDNYAWQGDPTVNVGGTDENGNDVTLDLKLRVSTDQNARTFQDRSSTFKIKPAP